MSKEETKLKHQKIKEMLRKGTSSLTKKPEHQSSGTLILVKKKDGGNRLVINLKRLTSKSHMLISKWKVSSC